MNRRKTEVTQTIDIPQTIAQTIELLINLQVGLYTSEVTLLDNANSNLELPSAMDLSELIEFIKLAPQNVSIINMLVQMAIIQKGAPWDGLASNDLSVLHDAIWHLFSNVNDHAISREAALLLCVAIPNGAYSLAEFIHIMGSAANRWQIGMSTFHASIQISSAVLALDLQHFDLTELLQRYPQLAVFRNGAIATTVKVINELPSTQEVAKMAPDAWSALLVNAPTLEQALELVARVTKPVNLTEELININLRVLVTIAESYRWVNLNVSKAAAWGILNVYLRQPKHKRHQDIYRSFAEILINSTDKHSKALAEFLSATFKYNYETFINTYAGILAHEE